MSWLVLTFTIKWSRIQGPGTRITDNESYYSVSAVYLLYSCLCFKIILKYKKIAHPEVTNLKSLMTISVRIDEHSFILYWPYINIVLVTVILHVGETYHNHIFSQSGSFGYQKVAYITHQSLIQYKNTDKQVWSPIFVELLA